jgi:hypothetical protein|uniref:Lipoprotein n=1 Tax=Desulfomonile tiedjei TaxID=2358 RepID=A0A7C4ATJ5_9BACT
MSGKTIVAALIVIASCASTGLCQRAMTSGDKPSQTQWTSHQMNQPAAPQYNLSQDRLDDIRRLYDQALTESRNPGPQPESKASSSSQTGVQK